MSLFHHYNFYRITNIVKYIFCISTTRKNLTSYIDCHAMKVYLSLEIVIISLPGQNSSL